MAAKRKPRSGKRTLDARPDTLDFRDRLYIPNLVEVPSHRPLSDYQKAGVPILDQGSEGACTGFGLAAVANYLLRTRKLSPDPEPVSARMLYEMARRYDEWAGEHYEGSSARGAMKGWHKHGVCQASLWPGKGNGHDPALSRQRAGDALSRPLGAYFRVNHRDLVALHAALAEVGILYASATVHDGWDAVKRDGRIPSGTRLLGGHAFAIVAYDQDGFWIQNSWGRDWGKSGFAHLPYSDWLENGSDIWVARLGAPMRLPQLREAGAAGVRSDAAARFAHPDLRPHIVSVGNDGKLRSSGTYGNSKADVEAIFSNDFRRITANWQKKRILLYAHGGLVSETGAIERVRDYAGKLLEHEVYPVAFIWKTDFWTTITSILRDALSRRRTEGLIDAAKDFMLDRLDDALEPLARTLLGKMLWDEMKENALAATANVCGGARLVAGHVAHLLSSDTDIELHLAGHSAGSIFLAPLLRLLTSQGPIKQGLLGGNGSVGLGVTVQTCTLWAPACTIELFHATYAEAIQANRIRRCTLFNLRDDVERDDHCGHIYNKSLLYLVSNAFEDKPRIPVIRDGAPLLGMDRFVARDAALQQLINAGRVEVVPAPNQQPAGSESASSARAHGAFDDDDATVRATLARILGGSATGEELQFPRSAASLRDRRVRLNSA